MPLSNPVFTIGHSTRSMEEFILFLRAHGVETVVDIRTIPRSRHCPQFNQDSLRKHLRKAKIGYRHMKDLGGLRHARKESLNVGWQNASFRGFADYMQTPFFQKALEKLETLAAKKRCALMCAEGQYFRCHRRLIADALMTHKWRVFHIQSRKTAKRHVRTPFLRVKKGVCLYW
jgi:uncharacterized protein (DUF488 family)